MKGFLWFLLGKRNCHTLKIMSTIHCSHLFMSELGDHDHWPCEKMSFLELLDQMRECSSIVLCRMTLA